MVSHSRQDIHARPLFEPSIVRRAVSDSFWKLNPIHQLRNPVMFTVWICSAFTTGLWAQALAGHGEGRPGFILAISLWLWFTLLFANFAEAMAEGRGKAQADSLRKSKRDVKAKRLCGTERQGAFDTVDALWQIWEPGFFFIYTSDHFCARGNKVSLPLIFTCRPDGIVNAIPAKTATAIKIFFFMILLI